MCESTAKVSEDGATGRHGTGSSGGTAPFSFRPFLRGMASSRLAAARSHQLAHTFLLVFSRYIRSHRAIDRYHVSMHVSNLAGHGIESSTI